jgi:hypothetical protein
MRIPLTEQRKYFDSAAKKFGVAQPSEWYSIL